jgi:hypothetical protein
MQHKWKILCLFIKQAKYTFICTIKPCLKFKELSNSYIYPNEYTFGCKKEICIFIKIRSQLIRKEAFVNKRNDIITETDKT